MPYPQDPFALKMRTPFQCPSCQHRPLIRETKDPESPFMAQVRCEQCGFTSEFEGQRAAQQAARDRK